MLALLAPITTAAVLLAGVSDLPLPNLQQPPSNVPENVHVLHKLLAAPDGRTITSLKGWQEQRVRIRDEWQKILGEFPKVNPPLKAVTLSTEVLDDFTRSHIKYQVEEGTYTDGYLLVPKAAGKKTAAVVVFHPTTPLGPKGVAGVDLSYEPDKWQGVQLVKCGFVVWCPRNYINTEGADWAGNARRVTSAHPTWTGMTRMVWDAIRAADYVQSLPEVDTNRIGCLGHSLGAKVVLYAMAFEERYRAGVFSEGGIGLRFSNWEAPWYLGARIQDPKFERDNDELLALIAPRPFLLLAGGKADGDASWEFVKAVMPIYSLLGARENIGWLNHHRGHDYPPEARRVAEGFLREYLGK